MSDGARDTKLLALIDSGILFNFMSSLVAKHLDWAIKPNDTLVAVKLASKTVVHSSSVANSLVSSGVLQAYVTFLALDVPFKEILGMPWLSHICLLLD